MTTHADEVTDGVEFARAMLAGDRASARLRMQLVDCAPGSATIAMTVTDDMLNGHAITHGGDGRVGQLLGAEWFG